MSSQTTEKWEKELRELDYKILCGKPGEYSDGDATFLRVKLLSQALQAAKEEERTRIAEAMKRIPIYGSDDYTRGAKEMVELIILAIINKHQ